MKRAKDPVKVLVVDDSAFMRKVISDILQSDQGIQVAGIAKNGREALEKIPELKPDVVTLDVEMPVMGGLECLEKIMELHPLPVVMLSSVTRKDADETIRALEHGAIDFISKPTNIFGITGEDVRQELIEKIRIAGITSAIKLKNLSAETIPVRTETGKAETIKNEPSKIETSKIETSKIETTKIEPGKSGPAKFEFSKAGPSKIKTNKTEPGITETRKAETKIIDKNIIEPIERPSVKTTPAAGIKIDSTPIQTSAPSRHNKAVIETGKISGIVAIGTSTGGPRALQDVIPRIPANIPAAIFIVQHMPPGFTKSLADRLDSLSEIKVKEGEDGEIVKAGCAYIAPGGYHMMVEKAGNGGGLKIKLSNKEPVGGHRPAVNVMMESISSLMLKKIIGVIMTGMGSDGCDGLKKLKKINNGYIIAQEEGTCVVYGMPKAAVQAGIVDKVVPLKEISSEIIRLMEVYS